MRICSSAAKIPFNSTLFDCVARMPIVSQSSFTMNVSLSGVKYAKTESGDSPVLSCPNETNLSQYFPIDKKTFLP